MCVKVWVRSSLLVFIAAYLISCGSLAPVRGLPPVLDSSDVGRASDNTIRILQALAADSRVDLGAAGSWYFVSQAGFNYIDDQCSTYFVELFRLNRRRESIKAGLSAFNQTTGAILAATNASALSMSVVAQAFGLATSMTDIVAGTYLYQLPPATTEEFVKKLQRAYRAGASLDRGAIQNPTEAYHAIQEYLSLCLPPTIEARLVGHVSDALAEPVFEPGAGISVAVGSQNRPIVPTIVRMPNQPLPGTAGTNVQPVRSTVEAPGWDAVTGPEISIDLQTAKAIQRALCLADADGVYGSRTGEALKIFESVNAHKFRNPNWQNITVSLSFGDINTLRDQKGCAQGAKNYLEQYLVRNSQDTLTDIGGKINQKYPDAHVSGDLVGMRQFIERWRNELGLNTGAGATFKDQLTPDFLATAQLL